MMLLLLQLIATLPDATLTPGIARGLNQVTVCSTRWGKDARMVTEAMKRQVAAAYKIPRASIVGRSKGPCCEFDHLISRELGGADDVKNLWPQPWAEATKKDALENWLHARVCNGSMTLADAQLSIAGNWIVTYNKAGLP